MGEAGDDIHKAFRELRDSLNAEKTIRERATFLLGEARQIMVRLDEALLASSAITERLAAHVAHIEELLQP